MFHAPEKHRILTGLCASKAADGNNGAFVITLPNSKFKKNCLCIASDGLGWEHVSVSVHNRCPTWQEMCFIKSIFWDETDPVVQYHPPKSEYINNHPFCLHLWRPIEQSLPMPPSILVGVK